jgi:hypothetical protein
MEINIFKAGEQTSSTGLKREFTEKDLDQIAESYNSEIHEAPIRIGHEDNSDKTPAWGWVKKVFRKGADLFAEVNFVPQMSQYIEDGLYRKVSASFYHPESNVNPHKGSWALRHVAVLGAEPPAVKGLKGFAYTEEHFDCSEEVDMSVSELIDANPELGPTITEEVTPMEELKTELEEAVAEQEQEQEQEVPETEPETEPEVEVEEGDTSELEEEEEEDFKEAEPQVTEEDFGECGKKKESYKEKSELAPPFQKKEEEDEDEEEDDEEEDDEEDFSESKETITSLTNRLAELEAQNKALQAKIRRAEIQEFIEDIYDSGRLTEEMITEEDMLSYMEKIDQGYVDFAEGESPLTPLMAILEKLPQAVCFTEVAKDFDFKEEELEETDLTPHEKALKLMGEDPGLEYTEALKKAIYE